MGFIHFLQLGEGTFQDVACGRKADSFLCVITSATDDFLMPAQGNQGVDGDFVTGGQTAAIVEMRCVASHGSFLSNPPWPCGDKT